LSRWGWAQNNSNGISRFIAIKIEPSLIFEVVQLALTSSFKIPPPRELLNKNTLWKDGFQGVLGFLEAIQGDAHIYVMGSMLHDVVH
jgi:hypothetical protein